MPPVPATAYDPSRRMFLGHLPPSCTRNDIMTLIKSRTKATPAHIDIALAKRSQLPAGAAAAAAAASPNASAPPPPPVASKKKDSDDDDDDDDDDDASKKKKKPAPKGEKKPLRPCAGYAHVTVEGLKGALESLAGATINGQAIVARQAKPHYLFKLDKVKRDRERDDEKKVEELEKITGQPGFGEIDKKKPLIRSMDAAKQKFGNIGSEIAAKARRRAKERKERIKENQLYYQQQQQQYQFAGQRRGRDDQQDAAAAGGAGGIRPANSAAAAGKGRAAPKPKKVAAPPPPPEPTKQEKKTDRKLSALEARLQALQAKLKK